MTEHQDHALVVVNPFVIHIVALATALLLQRGFPIHVLSTTAYRVLGTLVFFAGIAIGAAASRVMRAAKTSFSPNRPTSALVTTGAFARSRNPVYIAMLLNYLGLSLFMGSLWGLVLAPLVVLLMNRWVIGPEEAYLERHFGGDYTSYRSRVPRWL